MPSLRNQKLGEYAVGLTADQAEKFTSKLKISASISGGHYDQDRQVAVSVFDTTHPNAATNYNKGILLNDKALERAGADPARSGVTRITAKGETEVSSMVGQVDFFNKHLLMKRLVASDSETTVYAPDGSKAFLRRADFDDSYHGVISGDKAANWNAAYLHETDAQGNSKETPFLLARNRMNDKLTHEGEMARYQNFAREFGVSLADAPKFEGRELFSSKDDTERNYDVAWSQKGLAQIRDQANGADGELQLARTYSDAATAIDPERAELTKLNDLLAQPSVIAAGRAYRKVMDAPRSNSSDDQNARDNAARDFFAAAKDAGVKIKWGDTWTYAEAVGNAAYFSDQVRAITGSADQGQWVGKLNRALKAQDGYENLPEVLALSRLAGMDETIASVRVKYYGREFGAAETGAPVHPGTVVDHLLDPNSHTTRPIR